MVEDIYLMDMLLCRISPLFPTHKGVGGGSEVWSGEKIAFNYGREIFVYPYKGVKKAADLTKPIDKRIYKVILIIQHEFGRKEAN